VRTWCTRACVRAFARAFVRPRAVCTCVPACVRAVCTRVCAPACLPACRPDQQTTGSGMCQRACVQTVCRHGCVRACVRACVCACMRACVRACCIRAFVRLPDTCLPARLANRPTAATGSWNVSASVCANSLRAWVCACVYARVRSRVCALCGGVRTCVRADYRVRILATRKETNIEYTRPGRACSHIGLSACRHSRVRGSFYSCICHSFMQQSFA
jgi:hypothetical protein